MYRLPEILEGLRRPSKLERELVRRYFRLRNSTGYNDEGIDIFRQDWDNLLILDACRYDEFEQAKSLGGTSETRVSSASATAEFIQSNFAGRRLHDTVYVSANLWYPKLASEIDSTIHSFEPVPDGSTDRAIVEPEVVTDAARRADQQFPHKRLIVHYTQPHYPYVGELGREYFDVNDTPNLSEAVRITGYRRRPELVRQAYRENLQLVLDTVSDLLPELCGRTVVTADHGELLGERILPFGHRQYGHPEGIYLEPLVHVPWQVFEADRRKEIIRASSTDGLDTSVDVIDERLRDLGYKV